jgi:hypothetical protein
LTSRCFTPEQCTSDHERDLIIESPLPLGPLEKINVLQNFILEAIVEEIRFDYPYSNVDAKILAMNLNANLKFFAFCKKSIRHDVWCVQAK